MFKGKTKDILAKKSKTLLKLGAENEENKMNHEMYIITGKLGRQFLLKKLKLRIFFSFLQH